MDIDTRMSVLEARNDMIRSLVKSSIGWTLVLTAAVVGAVLAVNSQISELNAKIVALDANSNSKIEALENNFDSKIEALENNFDSKIEALENNFDSKFDALQDLIVQKIILNSDQPSTLIADQPVEQPKPTG